MRRTPTLAAAALLFAAPLAAQNAAPVDPPAKAAPFSAADSARYTALGKNYTRWFLNGRADSLLAAMSPETAEKMGGIEAIRENMNRLAERAGAETKVVAEKLTRRRGLPQFWHEGEFSEIQGDAIVIRWVMDEDGKLIGAGLGPKSQTPPPDPQ